MEYHLSLRLTAVVIFVILLEMAITGCVAGDIVIQAPVGEDVLLPCPFNYGLEDVDLLQWRRIDGNTEHLAEMNAQGVIAESPHHDISSNLDLLIRNVSFVDAGRYQCHVSHMDIMIPSTENYILLHLYARDSRDVQIGDNVILPCSHPTLSVEGRPVSWARQSHHLSSEHNLIVRNFSIGDVGLYECNVTSESDVTYIAHQTLLRTTVFTTENIRGHIGESTTFSCPSSGEHRNHPGAYWKKYPHRLSHSVVIASIPHNVTAVGYTVSSNFSLTIDKISLDDEGMFECYRPPTLETAGVLHKVFLHAFVATNETITGRVGENVTMSCPLSAELGKSGAHWKVFSKRFPGGKLIAAFPRNITTAGYTISSDFSLTIDKVSLDHDGSYECSQNATQETAGVLHTVTFHAYALPVTSPHIDGCRGDEKQCEQTILLGTHAYYNCRIENVYPERYPTWGEHDEYVGHSVNSDGTFNTWCVVFINGTNTPAERNCTFALEAFHESSHLVVKGHSLDYQRPVGWMAATFIFGFMFLLSFAALLYTHRKRFTKSRQKNTQFSGCKYNSAK